jgi:excisionase family DNA binding protein
MTSQLMQSAAYPCREQDARSVLEPEAVSVPETCRITGLGRSTIYQMIGDGRLPSIKVGKRRLVRTSTARRLIADREMVGINCGA